MLSQNSVKSDPGVLLMQAIYTCLVLKHYKSMVTHSNTPSFRSCIDFRQLNKATQFDSEPKSEDIYVKRSSKKFYENRLLKGILAGDDE